MNIEETIESLREMVNEHSKVIEKLAKISNERKHKISYLEAKIAGIVHKLESRKADDVISSLFGGK